MTVEQDLDEEGADIEEVVEVPSGWFGLSVNQADIHCVYVRQKRHAEGQPTVVVQMDDLGNVRIHIRGVIPGQIFVTDVPALEGGTETSCQSRIETSGSDMQPAEIHGAFVPNETVELVASVERCPAPLLEQ